MRSGSPEPMRVGGSGRPAFEAPRVDTMSNGQAAEGAAQSDDVWRIELERMAAHMLALDRHDVMDALTRQFEATLIRMALRHTGGRRIEAAQRLGIGRNTITRKIQDLGLDDVR